MRPINTRDLHRALMTDVLMNAADTGGGAGINSTAVRPEIGLDWPEGGAELPEQMLGDFAVLMPGAHTFRLPDTLAQLWHPFEAEDKRPGSKTLNQKVERWMLKFDKTNPLVVSVGAHTGMPLTCTMSNHPRPRGKADDPKTPWIADIAYLMAVSLADQRRPTTTEEMKAIINSYAGKEIRLQTGLSGQCRPDAVARIYVYDPTDLTFQAEQRDQRLIVIEDPTARKGCGKRFYTNPSKKNPTSFKNPSPSSLDDQYFTEVQCDGEVANPADGGITKVACNAVVRGWPGIDGFLPPLGAGK